MSDQNWQFDGPFNLPKSGGGDPSRAVGSGNQTIGKSITVPLTTPNGYAVGILQQQWPDARPRSVQLAFPPSSPGPATSFPPPALNTAPVASGLSDVLGNPIDATRGWLVAIIEYGCGGASQKMYCDWKPGAINLPASDFVQVSALLWGAAGQLPNAISVQASVSTDTVDGTHVPTATGIGPFVGATSRSFTPPAGARAIGVSVLNAVQPVVTLTGGAYAYFDYANHVFVPSAAVCELLSPVDVVITSSLDATLNVVWYLQP